MTAPGPLMPTYPPPPVTFVRGEGTHLYDDRGRRYLDLLSGLAVTSLGHAHPAVAEALAAQARTLLHVSNLFGNELAPEVARTLDRLVGDGVPAGGWNPIDGMPAGGWSPIDGGLARAPGGRRSGSRSMRP